MYDVQNSDGQAASAFKRGHYALINLLHRPIPNLTYGVEAQYGKRQNKGDGQIDPALSPSGELVESFDDFRIQFSVKFTFGTKLGGES
jgi:hypothetical protein